MNDLSPETNQLLDLARAAGGLTDARRSQLRASLLTQIAAIGLVAQVGASAATATAGASAAAGMTVGKLASVSGSLAKAISTLTLLSVTGAGLYAATRTQRAPEPLVPPAAPVARPALGAVAPAERAAERAPSVSPPSELSPEKVVSARARVASVWATPPAAVNAETLADETRLLRAADQALRAGNAGGALSLLDEHAARYPRGVLVPERNAERLIARCKLGQSDAQAAQAYLTAHANSAFAARIRDACAVASR